MTDYTELVKALRCKRDDCEGCDISFFDKDEGWMCQYAAKDDDAADAIEALQAEVEELKAKKMKRAENSLRFVGKVRELDKRRLEPKRGEIVRCRECRWGHLCVMGQHLGLDGFAVRANGRCRNER